MSVDAPMHLEEITEACLREWFSTSEEGRKWGRVYLLGAKLGHVDLVSIFQYFETLMMRMYS